MGKRHSKLAPRTLAELRDQTNFTVEEIQDWYKEFKSKWPKGVLTSEEFKKEYSTFFPLGDASEFAKHVFRVFDQNADGKLDFREFACGFSIVLRGRMEDKLKFSFQMYDINGNGFISREEMLEVLAAMYKVESSLSNVLDREDPEERTDSIFNQMDLNCDDKLSLEEFIEGVKKDPRLVKLMDIS
uniref:Neurocalcin-like protein n=1 Tax=Magallana gigas TaxID=29159 RepID=K1Q2P1_MAGGI|eukprot:XP_011426213.1 PREDICTED: neurocalcin homolog [Crassostrea gigas]